MSTDAFVVGPCDLQALAVGGCFFGSGGGGTLTSARNLLEHFRVGDCYPSVDVRVVPVGQATDGDSIVVAYMGAPAKIDSVQYPLGPFLAVERAMRMLAAQGRELKYIVPPESGALGFTVACLVAARFGLSVVDGDGAGRAVPSLPMLTFAAEGVPPDPTFLVSQGGLAVSLDVEAPKGRGGQRHQEDVSAIVDNMLRPIISESEFDEFGGLALWIMDPPLLRKALRIGGTLSRALALGRMILDDTIRSGGEMVERLRDRFGLEAGVLFGGGTFGDGVLTTAGGFDVGSIRIVQGERACISMYQNESLIAWDSALARPLAMAPDSIAYFLEDDPRRVASNGDLVRPDGSLKPEFLDKPVSVIGIAADPALRETKGTEQGLILASFMKQLGAMGYRGAYLPLAETLQRLAARG